eukprot:CAMPEP_0177696280 /NCGR_PEP_ID=MMETSP0484_2-20121128/3898_1 /TAXON_ID=354590 /ORGANISM="Rhodomonas lens, Strain RHODO" /LENGTH=389 /DNA_ID=CAMNT_0019207245 /DNA_START=206 /DNA_END=1371 /DNA_ORIENTATION=+
MTTVCGYLTDVEGNYDYFERYVAISRVIKWADDEKSELELNDGCEFVFGGDSQDKGIGEIRFVKHLLSLKRRYPERVHIIIGNRDANKLRLAGELSEEALADPNVKEDRSFPYWVDEKKRVTPAEFLLQNDDKNGGSEDSAANRLRWMLKETMGSDGAFERRRMELKIVEGREEISDEEVVESYRAEVDPDNGEKAWMLQYLQAGQLAYIFGRTIFVHGAISDANLGSVPGQQKRDTHCTAWVANLNAWAAQQVHEYATTPTPPGNGTNRPGSGLMDYGVPNGNNGETVIYASFLSNGNAAPISSTVGSFLTESNLCNVIAGHTPHGDCPTVIRSRGVRALTADTSYSEMGHKSEWGVDNRGAAVSEVLVGLDGSLAVHGILSNGSDIA